MRTFLILLVGLCAWPPAHAAQANLQTLILATPGPNNLAYLPADLISRIGADRAEGVELKVRHFPGGPLALKDMLAGNSDFAFAGMPAHASLRLSGAKPVTLAVLNQTATFVLMVRADLKHKIRRPADLAGRTIGVNTSSRSGKSTSQQLAEYLLLREGIAPEKANFVPAGQDYIQQHASITSGAVDALMGDEPFATRMRRSGEVVTLVDLHTLKASRDLFGGPFIHAALAASEDSVASQPDKAARMVRIVQRTLRWIAEHSPEEIVAQLRLDQEERAAMLEALRLDKEAFSPDGAFSDAAIAATERFFQRTYAQDPMARGLRFNDFINDHWAGRQR